MKVIDLRKETAVPKSLTLDSIPWFSALAKRVSEEISSDLQCDRFLILCGSPDSAKHLADHFWFGIDLYGIQRSGEIIGESTEIIFAATVYNYSP